MNLYITTHDPCVEPETPSDLKIDAETYKDQILQDWPGTTIDAANPYRSFAWSLPRVALPRQSGSYCLLHLDNQTVSVDLVAHFDTFIVWHRKIIQLEYVLFLSYEDPSYGSISLTMETTVEDMRRFSRVQ